jgi:hypothetical protein
MGAGMDRRRNVNDDRKSRELGFGEVGAPLPRMQPVVEEH